MNDRFFNNIKRNLAERVGFEPTSRDHREPLFESGALSQLGNLSFQTIVRSY